MKTQCQLLLAAVIALTVCCDEDENETVYDPEETVVTIDASECSNLFSYQVFMVAENKDSNPLHVEIIEGETLVIKRGKEIKGDLVNLHFFFFSNINQEIWNITSYYDVLQGKEINFKDFYLSIYGGETTSSFSGLANISFSDIPDFDVASRTYMMPAHAHTYSSLEYPCSPSFETGKSFYVCLQKGSTAGYKLVTVPEVSKFTVSLDGLNTAMTKYSFQKDPGYPKFISIKAYGSEGCFEIFNLDYPDELIFTGDYVDVFVPDGLPQMLNFRSEIHAYKNEGIQCSIYYDTVIVTDCSFLNADLSLSHTAGQMPIVNTQDEAFDAYQIKIVFNSHNNWIVFGPPGLNLTMPEFPAELLNKIAENLAVTDMLSDVYLIDADAMDDSRIADYNEAIEYYLLKSASFDEDKYYFMTDGKRLRY
ncbi:MAG: hypothetical protein JXA72_11335 [Bacteroidales bacterium]|nr:hypothetical protein [Bacteroidales bacterium]